MTLSARPFQADMLQEAREGFREHKAQIIRAPTGAGKTVIGTMVAKGAAEKGRRVMFTVHRDFLVDQTSATFGEVGLDHGIIAAGYTPNPRERVQVASIDTLKHRLAKTPRPDLLIVDECHHSVAAGWAKVIGAYLAAGTKVLGLSATPARLDGRGLEEVGYTNMVQGPSVRWLIDQGYLCDYEAYAPSTADLTGVHTKMGDFAQGEAEEAVDKPTITGDAIEHLQRHAPGKRAVAFCVSVKHSQHVCEQFNAAGIPAAHIDGTTPREARKRLLSAFRRGQILVLTSVDIFGEGFDLPAVEVAILLRPTQSLSLHLQQIGRALRVSEGKDRALILDHVGNLMRLGLPDSDFDWTLEGRKRRARKKDDEDDGPPIRQCEACFRVYTPPKRVCPYCGHEHALGPREIEQVDGVLRKLTAADVAAMKAAEKAEKDAEKLAAKAQAAAEAKARRSEAGRAKSLDELQRIEADRGYKPGWADMIWGSRQRSAQTRAEAQAEAYLFGETLMLLIPELETVLILPPRTGSGSLHRSIRETYPQATLLYRHMEADGVPQGYDRWRRVGFVRHPLDRLWSLYKFCQSFGEGADPAYKVGTLTARYEPAYVAAVRESVRRPFCEWLVHNERPFSGPYDSAGLGRYWPGFTVRHYIPETRKSLFVTLRPDLGTEILQFSYLQYEAARVLGVQLPHANRTDGDPPPQLTPMADAFIDRWFAWDIATAMRDS